MGEVPAIIARPSIARRAWFVAAMCFVAVRAAPVLTYPLGRDQATYFLIGQSLLEGKELYLDLWDNKPPGIFYLYAVIAKVFGTVMWSPAVVDILWLVAISYCIFHFTQRYVGSAGAAIAVMIHASWHVRAGYIFEAQPETFQLFFVFAAYFLMTPNERRSSLGPFAAGLLLGCAFWLKYNALAFLPFLLFVPYLDTSGLDIKPARVALLISWKSWLAKAGLLLAGFATAVGLVLARYWLVGAWPAMKEIQFEVMPRYATMALHGRGHYWLRVIMHSEFHLGTWSESATLAALCIAWRCHNLARFAPLFIGAALAMASTAMQLRLHDYYFQTCYPFLAIIWGYVCVKIYEGCRAVARDFIQRGWRLAAVLVWIVLANLCFWPMPAEFDSLRMQYEALSEWRHNPDVFYAEYPCERRWLEHLRGQLSVVRFLKENSAPRDGVFLWGAHSLIYLMSERRPPTRFMSNLGLIAVWTPPAWREELMRDLEKSPPRFIVVARRDALPMITYVDLDSSEYLKVFPKLNAFIANNYQAVADFDTFVVYRLKRCASTGGGALARGRSGHS